MNSIIHYIAKVTVKSEEIFINLQRVLKLLQQKKVTMNTFNYKGENGLHLACGVTSSDTARFFLENSSMSVNAITKMSETPMHYAVRSNNLNTVSMLCRKFAYLNIISREGTPENTLSINN